MIGYFTTPIPLDPLMSVFHQWSTSGLGGSLRYKEFIVDRQRDSDHR
jgi:hypothetical protein